MGYQLRHDNGNHWKSGNWIDPAGQSRVLDAEAIELSSGRIGQINIGGGELREIPMGWRLALAGQNRRWRIRPLYDQQWMDTSFPYWEGVVLVENENGERAGIGYMELTGYQ